MCVEPVGVIPDSYDGVVGRCLRLPPAKREVTTMLHTITATAAEYKTSGVSGDIGNALWFIVVSREVLNSEQSI